jgi:acyl-CoA synthetase (NDP forming)
MVGEGRKMKQPTAATVETRNLDCVFKPRSIAFVGATEGSAKWGFIVFNNLISGGYEGDIYPVNPGRETVMGFKCYPSVLDIPGDVDLAIFTVPAQAVINTLDDCAAKGVKAALVITAGFKELSEEGAALEAELIRKADEAGITLVGPNGEGICCPEAHLYPWMPVFYPKGGSVSVVAQSGNILNMLIGHALNCGFGVSKAVSSGNEAQLKTEDYIAYFGEDPDTKVIISYVEGVEDGRRFIERSRMATRSKPVVMLKGGRSSTGMRAAQSHTGAMAVTGDLFEAACKQAGIVIANTIQEAGITASSFVSRPLPRGNRVGIVTGGGGLGVIAADACSDFGLEVPNFSKETLDKVQKLLPAYFVPGNPIDLVAQLDLSVLKTVIETVMRSGEVDAVMFIFVEAQRNKGPNIQELGGRGIDMAKYWDAAMEQVRPQIDGLHDLAQEIDVPLYITANVRSGSIVNGYESLGDESHEAPMIYKQVETACAAIGAMAEYYDYLHGTQG